VLLGLLIEIVVDGTLNLIPSGGERNKLPVSLHIVAERMCPYV
jgi:hypothetical protein